jgi:hypothetical protein
MKELEEKKRGGGGGGGGAGKAGTDTVYARVTVNTVT